MLTFWLMANEYHISRQVLYSGLYSDETIREFLDWLNEIGYNSQDVTHCVIYTPTATRPGCVQAYVFQRDKDGNIKTFNGDAVTVVRSRWFIGLCPLLKGKGR